MFAHHDICDWRQFAAVTRPTALVCFRGKKIILRDLYEDCTKYDDSWDSERESVFKKLFTTEQYARVANFNGTAVCVSTIHSAPTLNLRG